MTSPSVAVIIPAYNAAATLPACLAAIAALTPAPDEVIVFIDGATDETEAIARGAGVRILRNQGAPLGPAHGRNVAASAARSDLLLFVDADVVTAPDALARLVGALIEHEAQAAFGSYDDRPRSRRTTSLYANLRHHFMHQTGARDAGTFWSGLGLIERAAFLELGGYDAALFAHPSVEDVELGARLVATGRRIRLVPEAQATHFKDWRLLNVWQTDILRRAYPWSCLMADGRETGSTLNPGGGERTKAAVAVAALPCVGLSLGHPLWLAPAAVLLAAYVVLNRAFFGFLARRLSPWALAQSVAMHWCYHIYASATFGLVRLQTTLGLRQPRPLAG